MSRSRQTGLLLAMLAAGVGLTSLAGIVISAEVQQVQAALVGEVTTDFSPSTVEGLQLDTNDSVLSVLNDGRVMELVSTGEVIKKFDATHAGRWTTRVVGGRRWIVQRRQALLFEGDGQIKRAIPIPRDARDSLILKTGDLAFLTPTGARLVAIVNQYGLKSAEFGEAPRAHPNKAQREWLSQALLAERSNGEIIVVFTNLPLPTIRRYSKDGKLLSEATLRSPGLDSVAEKAEREMESIGPECAGGLKSVSAAAYDEKTDTLWVATNADDGKGFVRIVTPEGVQVGQVQLRVGGSQPSVPVNPSSLVLAKDRLVWSGGESIWSASVVDIRARLKKNASIAGRVIGLVTPLVSTTVYAQDPCAASQSPIDECNFNCGGSAGTISCLIQSTPGTPPLWHLEARQCLAPTEGGKRNCRHTSTYCEVATHQRENLSREVTCPKKDNDDDNYDAVAEGGNDCDDNNALINPSTDVRAWYNYPNGCPSTPPAGSDVNCSGTDDYWECNPTPIVFDMRGNGFNMSSYKDGVHYDLDGDGAPEYLPWIATGADEAWLALDRNGNGVIDSGIELFGNRTPQPRCETPNGFIALAEFDLRAEGGNGDGAIDRRDGVFGRLLLWQDLNHDGVSQPSELRPLSQSGITSISLDYRFTNIVDPHGNRYLYGTDVTVSRGSTIARIAYDVFLTARPPSTN